jgi:catechol 2,3-dioxygenase
MTELAPETHVGPVELTVADLDRSLDYYRDVVGLRELSREDGVMRLGADGTELLALHEQPGAEPAPRSTGLFHFALLVPDREALARWLVHAAREQVPISGMSDHLVSEAIYLRDPDWHGIEVYRDRPRSEWPRSGDSIEMATLPLDTRDLVDTLDDPQAAEFDGLPAGTTMGHVHLQVADIPATERFYRDVLGFDVMARYGTDATFMAAGGYHHHLGANTWNSRGATPPPAGAAAMRNATIVFPDADERDRAAARVADSGQEPQAVDGGDALVRDPAGNGLLLTTA